MSTSRETHDDKPPNNTITTMQAISPSAPEPSSDKDKTREEPLKSKEIIVSMSPEDMANIVSGKKNHVFRKYKLPTTRMWIYETSPTLAVRYCAIIGEPKGPDDISVNDREGLGNESFKNREWQNSDGSRTMFAFKIIKLFQVKKFKLNDLKRRRWLNNATIGRFNWAMQDMVDELTKSRTLLFDNGMESS